LKARDRNAALAELADWLEAPESRSELNVLQYRFLINGFISFYKLEWRNNLEKINSDSKSALTYLNSITLTLKDMINFIVQKRPESLDSEALVFIQTVLARKKHYSHVYQHFLKMLNILVNSSTFKAKLMDIKWEEIINFTMDLITKSIQQDAKPSQEVYDAARIFAALITNCKYSLICTHAETILLFIGDFLNGSDVDSVGAKYLVYSAWRILIILHVDHYQLSFRFLSLVLNPLLNYVGVKNDSLKVCVYHLLKLYICLGCELQADSAIHPSIAYNFSLVSRKLVEQLIFKPPSLDQEDIPELLNYSWWKCTSLDKLLTFTSLDLCADMALYEMRESSLGDSSSSTSFISYQRKKRKMEANMDSSVLALLLNSKDTLQIGLAVILLMMKRGKKVYERIDIQIGRILLDSINSPVSTTSEFVRACVSLFPEWPSQFGRTIEEFWLQCISERNFVKVRYGTNMLISKCLTSRWVSAKSSMNFLDHILESNENSDFLHNFPNALNVIKINQLWSSRTIDCVVKLLFRPFFGKESIMFLGRALKNIFIFLNTLTGIPYEKDCTPSWPVMENWQTYPFEFAQLQNDFAHLKDIFSSDDSPVVAENTLIQGFSYFKPFSDIMEHIILNIEPKIKQSADFLKLVAVLKIVNEYTPIRLILETSKAWNYLTMGISLETNVISMTYANNVYCTALEEILNLGRGIYETQGLTNDILYSELFEQSLSRFIGLRKTAKGMAQIKDTMQQQCVYGVTFDTDGARLLEFSLKSLAEFLYSHRDRRVGSYNQNMFSKLLNVVQGSESHITLLMLCDFWKEITQYLEKSQLLDMLNFYMKYDSGILQDLWLVSCSKFLTSFTCCIDIIEKDPDIRRLYAECLEWLRTSILSGSQRLKVFTGKLYAMLIIKNMDVRIVNRGILSFVRTEKVFPISTLGGKFFCETSFFHLHSA
jgi:hypothetical protein